MATSAPKAAKPGAQPAASPDTGAGSLNARKKLLIIVGAALTLLAGAGGAWFYLDSSDAHASAAAKSAAQPAVPPVFLALDTFTVNLQSDEMQQFLQVGMTLQVANDAQVELIKANMPQVRNRLLLLLSSKKPAEILNVDGKKKLSADIVSQVREPFTAAGPKPDVTDVFFTSFVVQ